MSGQTIQPGATLTNGSRVVRLTRRDEDGWRGVFIALSSYRSQYTGCPDFIPDYLLETWGHVPFEWSPLPGSGLEHRYAWTDDCRWIRHEMRKAQ